MGRIARDIVDAIRDRTSIADVVGRRVRLQKRGTSLVGLCPFHQEKTPSFNVIPSKGIFHCFGCQAGGDVFAFVMRIEGLSFVEAVKELAGPAGVSIEEEDLSVEQRHAIRVRSTLFEVLEEATSYYESMLWTHPDGQGCRDYLKGRGIDASVLREARVGYAPDGWRALGDHLHKKGFPVERAVEAGLARQKRSGEGHYDFFRDRLMFPIFDDRGRTIGFGGRVLSGDGPKYLNTGETSLYDKSSVLYGIEKARNAIQRADQTIVVEGYFDVLAMRAAGHPEAVASCGTALTPKHLDRLSRMSRNLVLLTDGDKAGQAAAARSLPLLLDAGMHGFRVELPGAKDPDEYLQANGPEAVTEALEKRHPLLRWVLQRKVRGHGGKTDAGPSVTGTSREQAFQDLKDVLIRLPKAADIYDVARVLNMREADLRERIASWKRSPNEAPPAAPTTGWRPQVDMVHVFWLLIHCYDRVADLLQQVDPSVFGEHPETHPALARLLTGEPIAAVLAEESDPGVVRTLRAVVARQTLYEEDNAARALCDVLRRLVQPREVSAKANLTTAFEDALRDGDRDKQKEVLTAIATLKEDVQALERALAQNDLATFIACLREAIEAPSSIPSP